MFSCKPNLLLPLLLNYFLTAPNEGQLCQPLPQIYTTSRPTFLNNAPALLNLNLALIPPVSEWQYFQHNMTEWCMDLVFYIEVSEGRLLLWLTLSEP